MTEIYELLKTGGLTMIPLIVCSLAVWAVILERGLRFRALGRGLKDFHLEAINLLLRGQDAQDLRSLCARHPEIPLSRLVEAALDRLNAKEARLRQGWWEAADRRRQGLNQELRQNLWVLGTVASAAPFIGLFGTVVGILQSFKEMAEKGAGGFAVVAAGISEALVATAAGIIVAVVALMAYNAFQNHWNSLVLLLKLQAEELGEVLSQTLAREADLEGQRRAESAGKEG